MSSAHAATADTGARRSIVLIALAMSICLPAVVMRLADLHTDWPAVDALIFGIGVLSSSFLLSWAAETAELDISQGLALVIIALIAVLPEYAVDAVLAFRAGADPVEAEKGLAIANMTGGNRLLIGVAWPLVFAIFFYRTRLKELVVDRQRSLELGFLAVATLYVIFIPLRDHLTLTDTVLLVSLFLCYVYFTAKQESEELELVGPAKTIGTLSNTPRRIAVLGLLLFSAGVIFAAAEPFAESLVHTGAQFGISDFLLIQWLAPLASESPEVLVCSLLAWRGRATAGMGALISSKVNQWTLLIGTLPIAFALGSGDWSFAHGLPLDDRQREELFLTAAQSAFAIAVFVNLRMTAKEAGALFLLFATQLFITSEQVRVWYAAAYTALCIILLIVHRKDLPPTLSAAWTLLRGRELAPDDQREPAVRHSG